MVDGGTMVVACSSALGSEVDGNASRERDDAMRCGFWPGGSFSLGLG